MAAPPTARLTCLVLAFAVATALASPACSSAADAIEITDRTVSAGCGSCRFHRQGTPGCYWAVEIDGNVVPVRGALPADHDSHAPDGMCNVTRDAIVSGTLHGSYFVATRFDLQPIAPATVPEYDHDDLH